MDFRYSRTQRSRDIKLYLILWFIQSCIWWCWFLIRSFNGRDFWHSCPQMFRVIKLHLICSFIWCIWCFISWFWFWFTLPGIWLFWFLKRYFINSMDFSTQPWLEIKLSLLFWYLLSRRHTCKSKCILLENSGSWVPFAYIVGYLAKLGKICKSVVSTESHKLIWGRISSPIQSQICMSFISFGISHNQYRSTANTLSRVRAVLE